MIKLNTDHEKMTSVLLHYVKNGIITFDDVGNSTQEELMRTILDDIHKYKISKGKDGRWQTSVTDATKPTGRRLIRKKSKTELFKWLLCFYNIQGEGAKLKTFSDLFGEWIQYKAQFVGASNRKRSLSPSTIRRYERDFDTYIKPSKLSQMLICSITTPKLETVFTDIVKSHDMNEKCASNVLGYIRQAFQYARRQKYIIDDPAELMDTALLLSVCRFDPPKPDSERVLTIRELEQLHDAVIRQQEKHPRYLPNYAIELAMLTGMRVGELAALHWGDISDDIIHIDYAEHRLDYSYKKSELEIGEPKNGKHRVIQVTGAIERVFQKIKALGHTSIDDFIFVRKDGERYTGHDISCAVDRRASEAGIKKTSIHGIRRTVSSLLNTMLPQKAVAEMLGHTERVNEQFYNYSMAENAEKKRALEQVYAKVCNFSDYLPEEKKTGSA